MSLLVDLDGEDEEAFLPAVEAAEAPSSKRPRLSTSPSPTPTASGGSYQSAHKGSHSSAWKQQQEMLDRWAMGACFQCGAYGHWADTCSKSLPASGGVGGGGGGAGGGGSYVDTKVKVAEKECPCGSGICLVLTSSTPRNPGRRFYRCPTKDNGGCNFFEWCDAASPGAANARSNTTFQSDASVVDMPCSCGAGTCLIRTTKTGINVGRQFYRCPAQGGSSCGFFKWCDVKQQPRKAAPPQAASQYPTGVTSTNQNISKSSSGCFKCGQENHWVKECPNQSSDTYSDKDGTTSDVCFKCGKAGHWSRDCPVANSGSGGGAIGSHVKSSGE